jgi:hypothetical protein
MLIEFWNWLVFQGEGFCLPFVVWLVVACTLVRVYLTWGLFAS